jgi:hypothetical protein
MPWAPSYATADDLRDFVRIDDDADDAVLSAALAGASRMIDNAADPRPGWVRQFGRTDAPEARYFTPSRRGYGVPVRDQWVAVTDDIADPDGPVDVAVDGTGDGSFLPVTGCIALPINAAAKGEPGTSVLFSRSSMRVPPLLAECVRVLVSWGWPVVPEAIHEASMLQASRLVSRRDAPFGVAGSPETGSEVRLLARLDPDVENLVRPFVRKIGSVLA